MRWLRFYIFYNWSYGPVHDDTARQHPMLCGYEKLTPEQKKERDSCILDVGCGYGRTLDELYHNGYRNLIGIDFSSGMIERGKRQFPHLDLRVKEDTKIALPDASVDAVILFAVLTSIRTNEEQQQLLSEI